MATTTLAPPGRTGGLPINVAQVERIASLLGGGALVLYGLSRRSLGGLGLALLGGGLVYRGATGHCDLYAALGLSTTRRGARTSIQAGHGVKVEASVTVNRSAADLYRIWRQVENLPHILRHLESVRTTGPKRSHWVARGPLGQRLEWDAEIINERPNELIAWRSLPGSQVDTAGSVHFRPAADWRGTEVHVELKYDPPAGKVGAALAWLFGKSGGQQVRDDLGRFKEVMETSSRSPGELALDL
jgi:uncharacterized membrane protein